MESQYYIYMVECSNGAFYTGYTTDIERRYREHQAGSAKCKYTRSFPPKRLAACWQVNASLSEVLKIECFIKRYNKAKKQELVENPEILQNIYDYCSQWKS